MIIHILYFKAVSEIGGGKTYVLFEVYWNKIKLCIKSTAQFNYKSGSCKKN